MNPLLVQGAAQLLLGRYKSNKGMFMKNILTMAATGLVIFAALGWYLDWYKVNRTTTPDGRQHITIDLNTKRIETDIERGKGQVSGYLQQNGLPPLMPPAPPPPPQQQFFGGQPFSLPGNQSQPPSYPPPGTQPPPSQGWIPGTPTARPTGGGFVFPGQNPPPPPPSSLPGRPF